MKKRILVLTTSMLVVLAFFIAPVSAHSLHWSSLYPNDKFYFHAECTENGEYSSFDFYVTDIAVTDIPESFEYTSIPNAVYNIYSIDDVKISLASCPSVFLPVGDWEYLTGVVEQYNFISFSNATHWGYDLVGPFVLKAIYQKSVGFLVYYQLVDERNIVYTYIKSVLFTDTTTTANRTSIDDHNGIDVQFNPLIIVAPVLLLGSLSIGGVAIKLNRIKKIQVSNEMTSDEHLVVCPFCNAKNKQGMIYCQHCNALL